MFGVEKKEINSLNDYDTDLKQRMQKNAPNFSFFLICTNTHSIYTVAVIINPNIKKTEYVIRMNRKQFSFFSFFYQPQFQNNSAFKLLSLESID